MRANFFAAQTAPVEKAASASRRSQRKKQDDRGVFQAVELREQHAVELRQQHAVELRQQPVELREQAQ